MPAAAAQDEGPQPTRRKPTIIRNHFEALKTRKFGDIAREMHITVQEVQAIAERIGELDPKPGMASESEGARYIVPDLVVQKSTTSTWST